MVEFMHETHKSPCVKKLGLVPRLPGNVLRPAPPKWMLKMLPFSRVRTDAL